MKILFPHGDATEKEIEELLCFAIEGRKRVKEQTLKIDSTFPEVHFGYTRTSSGKEYHVKTLEEKEYPQYFKSSEFFETEDERQQPSIGFGHSEDKITTALKEQHLTFQENQKGICFDALFGPYLKDTKKIEITDPYIRLFYQARNLMELLETIAKFKPDDKEVEVHLITIEDEFKSPQQQEWFSKIQENCQVTGIQFTWEFVDDGSIHGRQIITDHGWKIVMDRGLDVFQPYDMNDSLSISNRLQQYRPCKAFYVTFLNVD
jgi:ATP-dependent Lon protease